MEREAQVVYLFRDAYTAQSSHGEFFFENDCDRFSYSLEDTVRPEGIKVPKHTAILGGSEENPEWYTLTITRSSRFKRDMVLISNTDIAWVIRHDGTEFKGCRVHGGNSHGNTEGCPLTAKHRYLNTDSVQGTMEKQFTARVAEMLKKGPVRMAVINRPQAK